MSSRFPAQKRFAFTIFDDTDRSTLENTAPVYRFLSQIGLRTTKSVWCLPSVKTARIDGATLDDQRYREFIVELNKGGFEIALHNVRNYDTPRKLIKLGFDRFRDTLHLSPRIHCNHDTNRENLYWGPSRIEAPAARLLYNAATRFKYRNFYGGHEERSPYFWGDICKNEITYVRNFVFNEINLDRVNPTLPYHDPTKPLVNFWFSSTEGGDVESFCKAISEANQDRLEEEGGVCIMYTHFAAGFAQQGQLHAAFSGLMRRLAAKNGWFVPVAQLLDHLRSINANAEIPRAERVNMERRWLFSKFRTGTR